MKSEGVDDLLYGIFLFLLVVLVFAKGEVNYNKIPNDQSYIEGYDDGYHQHQLDQARIEYYKTLKVNLRNSK